MRVAFRLLALIFAGLAVAATAAQELQRIEQPDARFFWEVYSALNTAAQELQRSQAPDGRVVARGLQSGTGRIRGRVASLDSGTPVRRAEVRLASVDGRSTKVTATDTDGSYEFTDLPAGRYLITVSKAGYLTLQHGQRRPFEPGKPVELAAAQALDNTDLVLPRGGAITGRIVDDFGDPVAEVTVQALRYQYNSGRRRLAVTGRAAQTDDIGQFRIAGLPPGEYFVAGGLRGPGSPALNSDDPAGYAQTYYPGTASPADAHRVTVGLSEEVPAINFSLNPVRLARVSGIALDSQGAPIAGAVVLLRTNRDEDIALLRGNAIIARSNNDGTFFLGGLPPGEYVLQVRAARVSDIEFGSLPVSVSGSDIDGLVIMTSSGAAVSGRVIFGGSAAPPTVSAMQVRAISTDTVEMSAAPGLPGAQDAAAVFTAALATGGGMFQLRGLSGGRLFRIFNPPAGWNLKSVRLGGVDITDIPYEFKGGETIANLEIELTDRTTRLNGTVTDSRNERVKEYAVVVFPDDRKRWGFNSRFVRAVRSDSEGRFQIQGLPPGRYVAVALEYLEQGSEADPELLERLRSKATALTLDEGETRQLTLTLSL